MRGTKLATVETTTLRQSQISRTTATASIRIRTVSKTATTHYFTTWAIWKILLLLAMVDNNIRTNSLLIPSQVRQKKAPKSNPTTSTVNSKHTKVSLGPLSLVPSQVLVLKAHSGGPTESPSSSARSPLVQDGSTGSSSQSHLNNQKYKRSRGRKEDKSTVIGEKISAKRPANSGNLPDVYWRSIPLEHLRLHPHFEALPEPETIRRLDSLEDIRLFRQDSWQWDAVHEGRCTTSRAVAALGFLEPEAGKMLGIPQSWMHGGLDAYHVLRKRPLRTLEEMNEILCSLPSSETAAHVGETARHKARSPRIWRRSDQAKDKASGDFSFAAKYMIRMTQDDLDKRRQLSKTLSRIKGFDFSVRMKWGNAQEATSLLTALNYFWEQDSGIILKEVGMCGGGLKTNHTTSGETSSLLVGATPDGLLCYPNGTIEALEVKNHCPFFPLQNFQHRSGGVPLHHGGNEGKRFTIRRFDIQNAGLPSQHIPQLMMEMLCVGEKCRSSIMVRQTATSGSLILRIHRDDVWIEEMLYWLNRFQNDFVEREKPPPSNFFLRGSSDTDQKRYINFLEKTKELQGKVEVVQYIHHAQIQRAMAIRPGIANLFLD